MGTVPINLPLIRTAELQLSMSFSNLAVPAIGGMAAQIRFLQKQGVDLASAVASGGLLINVGNIVAQIMLLGVAILLSPTKIHVEPIDTQKLVTLALAVLVVLVVAVGLIMGIPKLRNYVVPPTKAAAATLWAAIRSPRRVALLLGGNAINALMYAAVYMCCIAAFGGIDQLLDAALAQHHHLHLGVARPGARWQHRGVIGGDVGCARRRRRADVDRGRGGARRPARVQLPPRGARLVGDERPAPRRLPVSA